ncbi:hypothetical protein [Massilia glaciei]|uniref:hypothetical protein n=1 Tax=Massilia glaciei TaxID=1524097 RepID=UPI0015E7F7E3|nr:hypothetical protein [Massilia glaciei]
MWLLMVEAAAALGLLVFIVWWTMFSGREPEKQERIAQAPPEKKLPGDDLPPA